MIREEFQAGQWQFPFVVYHPETMSENLPMIIQLHGAGERGNGQEELERVDVHGFSKMLQQGGEYPCVFVMPQCSPESFWAAEVPNIYGFIQAVKRYYQADEKRIYLTGLSRNMVYSAAISAAVRCYRTCLWRWDGVECSCLGYAYLGVSRYGG